MKTLFHGTTLSNWLNIKKEDGFAADETTWNCSSYNETYFYDIDKGDYDEAEENKTYCIEQAFSNAQISAAVQNYNGNTLVVLELEVPENLVEDDCSCENMAHVASVVNNDVLDLSMIKKIHICENGYLPSLRLFYVAGLIKTNSYLQTRNFNNTELEIAEKTDFPYIEDLFYFDYETENVYFEALEVA